MTARHHEVVGELVVPDGLVIDAIAVERLHAQLCGWSDAITAVIAPVVPLPSGSSFRVVAERAGRLPATVARPATEQERGVALVRNGVAFEAKNSHVDVSNGTVYLDPGAPSHDETTPLGPIEQAVEDGRSPFPRAPMVVLLALEDEPGRAVWARNLTNALFAEHIEARLALASPPVPPHRCRPCLPEPGSITALQPDIIVTLDDTALDVAPSWCDRRSTVIVHHTGERTLASELVTWRVGQASGRLRAFIGSSVTAPELAALCGRLCSGPFPVPPPRDLDPRAPIPTRVRSPRRPLNVSVVHDAAGPGDRLDVFLAEAAAQGATTRSLATPDAPEARDDDVVILSGHADGTAARQLIETRADRGRHTIVDVSDRTQITSTVDLCGRATAATAEVQSLVEERGVTVRVLPNLLPRPHLSAMGQARDTDAARRSTTLTLFLDQPESAHVVAVEHALDTLLHADEEFTIGVRGHVDALPPALLTHPRVTTSTGLGRVQVWLGSAEEAARTAWPRPLVEAALVGVLTAFPADCRGDVDDPLVCCGALTDPTLSNQWLDAIHDCLAPANDRKALERRADFLFGRTATMSIVRRLLGWAGFRADRA